MISKNVFFGKRAMSISCVSTWGIKSKLLFSNTIYIMSLSNKYNSFSCFVSRDQYKLIVQSIQFFFHFLIIKYRRIDEFHERIFNDIDNTLDYLNDYTIISKNRLSRYLIINLCNIFEDRLQRPTGRSHAFSVSLQAMVALRSYAKSAFRQ